MGVTRPTSLVHHDRQSTTARCAWQIARYAIPLGVLRHVRPYPPPPPPHYDPSVTHTPPGRRATEWPWGCPHVVMGGTKTQPPCSLSSTTDDRRPTISRAGRATGTVALRRGPMPSSLSSIFDPLSSPSPPGRTSHRDGGATKNGHGRLTHPQIHPSSSYFRVKQLIPGRR